MDTPPERRGGGGVCGGKCICLSVTATLLSLGLLFLILGLTVFKPRRPTISITSVAVSHLDFALDLARLRVLLNVSLDSVISVHNPNRVGFKYHRGDAILSHRGNQIGDVPVPAGKIGSRETRSLNLTISVMADRIASDSALFTDVVSGVVPFRAYVRLSGKVRIVFSIHVTAYSTCDVDLVLSNQTISNLKCHYRTKL
ncbi:hypothetical protein C2S52_007718 [Perilla frutescens var. hirtella]|nr:hypothetical protein C2S51_008172 [Perilla frutescens var. frutescens]KAH6788166.1 hypothetical protein C2S52_007718 [Perilla frutescens var. hirtella]